jgi:hypothetical protein
MNLFTHAVVKAAAQAFSLPEPVIEVGSKQYGDDAPWRDLRSLFPGKKYVGCDLAEGTGVDRIEDLTKLTFRDGEVGTMLCLHILEHLWDVFAATREIRRVVGAGGAAIIVVPFHQHLHRYPHDFWRFTDDTMRKMLEGFPYVVVGRHGYESMPREVFAIGLRTPELPDFEARCARFKEAVVELGREPVGPWTRFRIGLGYRLFGKKYFRDFIHRDEVVLDLVKPGPA